MSMLKAFFSINMLVMLYFIAVRESKEYAREGYEVEAVELVPHNIEVLKSKLSKGELPIPAPLHDTLLQSTEYAPPDSVDR